MDEAVKTLERNIAATIKAARRKGTVGMSLACLKQNTSTAGLVCSVGVYEAAFEAAARNVAGRVRGFRIYR
jgi:hypothetical protein